MNTAVKGKQKSLSREEQDRFDEVHAQKFKSTSGQVECSHRSNEKLHLKTTLKRTEKKAPKQTNPTSPEY